MIAFRHYRCSRLRGSDRHTRAPIQRSYALRISCRRVRPLALVRGDLGARDLYRPDRRDAVRASSWVEASSPGSGCSPIPLASKSRRESDQLDRERREEAQTLSRTTGELYFVPAATGRDKCFSRYSGRHRRATPDVDVRPSEGQSGLHRHGLEFPGDVTLTLGKSDTRELRERPKRSSWVEVIDVPSEEEDSDAR